MSSSYRGRHRSAPTQDSKRKGTTGLPRALRRPAVTSSLLLAVVATTAAGYQAADDRQTGAAAFTVSTEAIAQANELADAQIEDTARLAADRNATNASVAAVQEKDRLAAVEAARAAAKARREAAQRIAREKARKALEAKKQALLDNARKDPRSAARALLPEFGFEPGQWSCLDQLWMGESGWRYTAENPSSGAYGIPQSLPASKMGTVDDDWRTNPVTQIRWGLQYIKASYGTPCSAWSAWQSRSPHWY